MTDRLQLTPMTDAELADFLAGAQAKYAQEMIELGGQAPERAHKLASQQFGEFFPEDRPGAGHVLFVGRATTSAEPIGIVWLHLRDTSTGKEAFVYDVEVDADRRGEGWGRALMVAAEEWATREGANQIGLHVFGANTVARGLYASLGYDEKSVILSKMLGH